MKHLIVAVVFLMSVSLNAQRGYFRPGVIGWPTDSSAWLTLKWNPDIDKVAWSVDGMGNDSAIFDVDTVCITQMGIEYCVNLDSIYYTDTTLCWIILPDTFCISWSSANGNFYIMDGTFTGARTGELGSYSLKFTEGGVTRFRLNHNATSPGELLTLTENYTSASQSMLALSNSASGADSDALMRFQSTGASGRHYSLGVDRSASAFTFAENNNLGTGAWMRYYGDGDSLVIEPLTLLGGSGLRLRSNNTTAASGTQKLFEVSLLGANATSSQTTYAGYFSNTHTGSGFNRALSLRASGGSSNIGLEVECQGANGQGVYVNIPSGAMDALSSNATSGRGGVIGSQSGTGLYGYSQSGLPFMADLTFTGSSGTVSTIASFRKFNFSTAEADGVGGKVNFILETETNASYQESNAFISSWIEADNATRTSRFTLTGVGSATTNDLLYFEGDKRTRFNGRAQFQQGADVASVAGAIVLGYDGNVFEITGTNAITLISNLGWQNGSEVTMLFTSTASLTDGTANSGTDIGMELAGNTNFSGSADDIITLVLCEIGGTQRWLEKSRSVN